MQRLIDHGGMALAVLIGGLLLAGCMISDQKDKNNDSEKVEMATPLGGLKVQTNIDPKDVGLSVYPGARLKPSEDSDHDKSANVNIQTPFFGMKVIVLDYVTDDPPQKVVDYYKKDLGHYGKVVECQGTNTHIQADHLKLQMDCSDSVHGDGVELKAGDDHAQHVVGVSPEGKGSEFALVYIRVRGDKDNTI